MIGFYPFTIVLVLSHNMRTDLQRHDLQLGGLNHLLAGLRDFSTFHEAIVLTATIKIPQPANMSSSSTSSPTQTTQKRRAIQSIMADLSLTDLERRVRIQQLMDGSQNITSNTNDVLLLPRQMTMDTTTISLSSMTISNNNNKDVVRNNSLINNGKTSITNEKIKDGKEEEEEQDEGAAAAAAPCIHYENNCDIISPCCNRIFGCRVCHDDAISNNNMSNMSTTTTTTCGIRTMDRFAITKIICRNCHTKQSSNSSSSSNNNCCIACNIQLSEYHCHICNIWMTNTTSPFHCRKCGFCRVGGSENYKHCDTCCMCLSVTVYNNKHDCKIDKYKSACPVCREDMFISRQSPVELPCGHAIHVHCFRSLTGYGDSRCPICKKTVVNRDDMILAWTSRARDIEAQPMPNDLTRIVDILCNDCEGRSGNRDWHFLGVQCLECLSFNTVVQKVVTTTARTASNNMDDTAGGEGL